ncbi:MAG: DegT/DnrJ/EryC1/StrS family aminotransferase [Polyangiaceae bacterium]|jgi:dTDP-4-amino-4,6-dideoxygalactose transaminase
MRVPLADLAAQDAEVADEVLASVASLARDASFILGSRVEAFERWLAEFCGVDHAVGVASGSDALELVLRALGVGPGDAVVTPAVSFIAAAEAIALVGARPVFCDVEAGTLNASARTVGEALERARRAGWRVRAIVPVHLFGRCAPMRELRELSTREGLALIEDAAQAIGGRDESGMASGASGDAGCFSFFPAKNLGAWGDGGAVVTSRGELAAEVRTLRSHGTVEPYVHARLGRNSRLDALHAAVLLVKSRHLTRWQEARRRLVDRYRAELRSLPLILPTVPTMPAVHAWHAFVVRSSRRPMLIRWLHEQGIDARAYYPLALHRQPCFAHLAEPQLEVAEEVCRTAVALPIFPVMREDQQAYVIEQVTSFFQR